MEELLIQARTMLRAMWRHRWLGLACSWLAAAVGATIVLRVPDKYEAAARIFVDTQSMLKPLMSGLAVQPNVDQQVQMLSRTLISRPNVEKLVRMADLDLKIQKQTDKDALIDELMKTLEIKSTSRDNLYSLSYRDPSPESAQRVVQSLVSIFVESSLGSTRKDTDTARKFIEDQIKVYEKKLEEAETRLKEFKLRNVELQLGSENTSSGRMSQLTEQLQAARLELREAENSREALKRQLIGEEPVLLPDINSVESSVSIPEIDGRIDALKKNLDGLLQKYTEEHPDVVGTRRVLKDLEEQKRKEVAVRMKAAAKNPAVSINGNPYYQQMKVALAESEARVASLRARVGEYETRYGKMKEQMKTVPQIEAEFTQLNRDYDINKKNYEQLVSRRESASLSGDLESVAGVVDFRLIDPPRVSPKPVAPNRMLLLALALIVALTIGGGVTFVASQLRPVFMDAKTLRDITGLPLLGTVTLQLNETRRVQRRVDIRRFLSAIGILVGVYGAGILFLFVRSGGMS